MQWGNPPKSKSELWQQTANQFMSRSVEIWPPLVYIVDNKFGSKTVVTMYRVTVKNPDNTKSNRYRFCVTDKNKNRTLNDLIYSIRHLNDLYNKKIV